MKTSIRLLRHGICEGGNIFRGHWDSPLSREGHQQMLAACAELQDIDVIISSPLQRCRQVAEELAQQYSNSDLLIEEGLKEINFGDWEGANIDALMESQQSQLEAFWSDPVSNSPPNGETMVDFNQRVCQAWHKYFAAIPTQTNLIDQPWWCYSLHTRRCFGYVAKAAVSN